MTSWWGMVCAPDGRAYGVPNDGSPLVLFPNEGEILKALCDAGIGIGFDAPGDDAMWRDDNAEEGADVLDT